MKCNHSMYKPFLLYLFSTYAIGSVHAQTRVVTSNQVCLHRQHLLNPRAIDSFLITAALTVRQTTGCKVIVKTTCTCFAVISQY